MYCWDLWNTSIANTLSYITVGKYISIMNIDMLLSFIRSLIGKHTLLCDYHRGYKLNERRYTFELLGISRRQVHSNCVSVSEYMSIATLYLPLNFLDYHSGQHTQIDPHRRLHQHNKWRCTSQLFSTFRLDVCSAIFIGMNELAWWIKAYLWALHCTSMESIRCYVIIDDHISSVELGVPLSSSAYSDRYCTLLWIPEAWQEHDL